MISNKQVILNEREIEHKLRRIAYQIYESNANENVIVLAGIADNGYLLAEKIKHLLNDISDLQIELCKVTVDKKNPHLPVVTDVSPEAYKNKSVVLIDDVLNSGSTLIYGVKHFLNVPLKQFKTAVLVNRNHKKFPVKADFKGISLSTSINEHVEVVLDKKPFEAFLT
jgi:pyrimidine operon attenuation protein/uracil phosphoribosyltransferase